MERIEEADVLKKWCPYLNKWCISQVCACWIQITQTQRSSIQGFATHNQIGMCSLPALCLIMTSLVQQPSQKKPNVILPTQFNKG